MLSLGYYHLHIEGERVVRICVVQNVSIGKHLALSTYIRNLVESLAKVGTTRVTALVTSGYDNGDIPDGVNIYESGTDLYSPLGNLQFIWWCLKTLKNIGRKEPIDVIHAVYPSSSTIASLLYKFLFSPKSRVIYDIRSPWIDMSLKRGRIPTWGQIPFRAMAIILERVLLKLVDGVVFITNALRDYYNDLGMGGRRPILVAPSGIDLDKFHSHEEGSLRQLLGINSQKRIIGYVGGIAETRNLQFVVDAFNSLSLEEPNRWALVFIGDGDDFANLRRRVDNSQDIHFMGRVPHSDVPIHISRFDLGLCHLPQTPLFNMSFPMKILEYLACGVPVMVSDIPAHRQLAAKLTGIVTYGFSAEEFIEGAKKGISGLNINRKELNQFTWESIALHLSRFYSDLLKSADKKFNET